MSTCLLVLNPREIPQCMTALHALDVPTAWCSYMPEILVAEALNRVVRETDYDRYAIISDDGAPTRPALDAVLAMHDEGHPVVTGYSNLDATLPFCNLTWGRLHAPPPTVDAYQMFTLAEVKRHEGPMKTTFAGLCLTVMSREMWLRFPLRCTVLGGQMDYQLSWELQEAGVPIVAAPDGFVLHVKERWNQMDTNPAKRLLIGERPPSITWPGEDKVAVLSGSTRKMANATGRNP